MVERGSSPALASAPLGCGRTSRLRQYSYTADGAGLSIGFRRRSCHGRPGQHAGRGYFVPRWSIADAPCAAEPRVEPLDPWWNPVRVPGGFQPTLCSVEVFASAPRTGWKPGGTLDTGSRVSSQAFVNAWISAWAGRLLEPPGPLAGSTRGFQPSHGDTNEKSHPKVALEPGTLVFHSVAGGVSDCAHQHRLCSQEEPILSKG